MKISCRKKIAVLQIIPKQEGLLPNTLVHGLALLEYHNIEYSFYDLEGSPEPEMGEAIENLFSRISEEEVIVSLSAHFNYPKLFYLVFLFTYFHFLKNKRIYICSPYLSFYNVALLARKNVSFHFTEVDVFLMARYHLKSLNYQMILKVYPVVLEKYNYLNRHFWTYLTSGCRSVCSFCHNRSLVKGAPALVRSDPDQVIAWMKVARALGVKRFQFADPNFLADKRFTEDFLDRLIDQSSRLPWRCKVRLDLIDQKIYEKMLAAGCDVIFFGFEHVTRRLIDHMNKGEDPSRLFGQFMKYWGGRTSLDISFLTGIKGEKVEDLRDNLTFISALERIPGIEVQLGYVILYYQARRQKTYRNYLVAILLMINSLPEDKTISLSAVSKYVSFCMKEKFFDFCLRTENANSLFLFQEMARVSQKGSGMGAISPFLKLMEYDNGQFMRMAFDASSLSDLNMKVLQKIL